MLKGILEPNEIRVKVMYQLTSVFFLYQAHCFVFLITDALVGFELSLHNSSHNIVHPSRKSEC